MKSRILMCFIVFVIAITNISCHNEPEGSTTGSIKSVTDDPKGDSGDEDDVEYSDEYFVEKYSIYRNPIDQYYWTKLYSWDASQVEIRSAQRAYKKAWKSEFKNLLKWLDEKCVFAKDRKNLALLEKSVTDQTKIEKEVLKTDMLNAYKVNPDPEKAKKSVSRVSLVGNGTHDRLFQTEGELYRDVCMRILNVSGYEEYEFIFREPGDK